MEIAYIGLGGNVASAAGTPEVTLTRAVERLGALGRVVRRSRLYSTAPVGYAEQPRFVNAVVALETQLTARALLDALLGIEREFGRDRSHAIPNGPRTLDLDILLYGSYEFREPEMEIPHPRLAERAFVLVPLNEVAPEVIVPGVGRSVSQLLSALKVDAADAVMPIESGVWHADRNVQS
jgi:2-amino-4-hydroxy-6-hydroxymethyldihydropteridine diphosphokinase